MYVSLWMFTVVSSEEWIYLSIYLYIYISLYIYICRWVCICISIYIGTYKVSRFRHWYQFSNTQRHTAASFCDFLEQWQSGLNSVALQRVFQINELLLNWLWQMRPQLHWKWKLKPAKRLVITSSFPEIAAPQQQLSTLTSTLGHMRL